MKTGDEATDAAADLLKMRTARIIKAPTLDPEEEEMRARTRDAMRRMKGVKLQISDERITFDDVAGIGEAKVRICPSLRPATSGMCSKPLGHSKYSAWEAAPCPLEAAKLVIHSPDLPHRGVPHGPVILCITIPTHMHHRPHTHAQ